MTLPKEFWDFIPIQPIPTLDALRNAVLERTTKRMPKWKFKLADPPLFPKIVMTLQPKVLLKNFGLPGFQGEAKMDYGDELHCDITFRLLIGDQWRFKAWSAHRSRHAPFTDLSQEITEARDGLLSSLVTGFSRLHPGMMFEPACLLCGKALTDPISQARWIGPECARAATGSASILNPFLLAFKEAIPTIEVVAVAPQLSSAEPNTPAPVT